MRDGSPGVTDRAQQILVENRPAAQPSYAARGNPTEACVVSVVPDRPVSRGVCFTHRVREIKSNSQLRMVGEPKNSNPQGQEDMQEMAARELPSFPNSDCL